jgi:CHAT domain-containing protein
MERFHRALASGMSADRALREAQLAALAEPGSAHPSRWAAFQLFGAGHG